jgi:hypothetical protein
VNPTLAGVALAVAAGTVIAASAREPRAAFIGLALALGLGPFLADPLPGPAVLGARVVSGILVVYLLRAVSTGEDGRGLGSRVGWPAEAVLALAAAVAGVALAATLAGLGPGAPTPGSPTSPLDVLTPAALALAAGLASIGAGFAPAFLAAGSPRTTIGLLLMVQGVVLARTGVAGPPGDLEQLGIVGLTLAVGAAGGMIAILERRPHGRNPVGEPEAAETEAR